MTRSLYQKFKGREDVHVRNMPSRRCREALATYNIAVRHDF